MEHTRNSSHTCPWWLLFTFDNPLRRLVHDPVRLLAPYVRAGDTALDVGCGMGYFSLALAQLTAPDGRVIAADLQREMLDGLRIRAARLGLLERITILRSDPGRIGPPGHYGPPGQYRLEPLLDFALAFWMVHEVGKPRPFLEEIASALKPGGRLLVVEPKIHVTGSAFESTVHLAQSSGLELARRPVVWGSRAALFIKTDERTER